MLRLTVGHACIDNEHTEINCWTYIYVQIEIDQWSRKQTILLWKKKKKKKKNEKENLDDGALRGHSQSCPLKPTKKEALSLTPFCKLKLYNNNNNNNNNNKNKKKILKKTYVV